MTVGTQDEHHGAGEGAARRAAVHAAAATALEELAGHDAVNRADPNAPKAPTPVEIGVAAGEAAAAAALTVARAYVSADWERSRDLIRTWNRRARDNQAAHGKAADRYARYNNALGVPATVLGALAAASGLATLTKSWGTVGPYVTAGLGVVSAALTAVLTRGRYSEERERHAAASAGYGAVRRALEIKGRVPRGDAHDFLVEIAHRLDELAKNGPSTSRADWVAARRAIEKDAFLDAVPGEGGEKEEEVTEQALPPAGEGVA